MPAAAPAMAHRPTTMPTRTRLRLQFTDHSFVWGQARSQANLRTASNPHKGAARGCTSLVGMPNRLAGETSPYLLQHKDNPVDWRPWGDEALAEARARDAPVLVSIGYSACHWCHVMERESFEDSEVAAYMNGHLVCVKVDREERPDVDAIYM